MALGDWTLTITGTVVRIDRENIDKSGRHPKFMLSFVMRPEQIDAPPEATLPDELAIRIADRELPRLGAEPRVGERVTMTARASGPKPATFYLASLTRP
jgi:hypothetical protein